MTLWPIGKDLDLSFIRGHHHLHIVGLLRDPAKSKQLSTVRCNLAFSLDSIVSLPRQLSFLRSISLASLFNWAIRGRAAGQGMFFWPRCPEPGQRDQNMS